MNPFDPRSALLAKHAQHVVMIHFPIALFFMSVAFDLIALRRANPNWGIVAYYNSAAAALATVPAIATGLLAWQVQLEGKPLRGILRLHLVLALLSTILIWFVWGLQHSARRERPRCSPAFRCAVELVAVSLTTLAAHAGGFLSGVNVPG
jgi:uncharacterized membrane protein